MMMLIIYFCVFRSYGAASKCVAYLLYVCSDIKQKYEAKLDQFEYACSHLTDKDGMHSILFGRQILNTFLKRYHSLEIKWSNHK